MPNHSYLPAWDVIEANLESLLYEPLTPDLLPSWLARWSESASEMRDAWVMLLRATALDTTNKVAHDELEQLVGVLNPAFETYEENLRQRVVKLSSNDITTQRALDKLASEMKIYSEDNLNLVKETDALENEYEIILSKYLIDHGGQNVTVQTAQAQLSAEVNRDARHDLWQRINEVYLHDSSTFPEIYLKLCRLRQQMARNVGLTSYRDYNWRSLGRTGYTPDDASRLLDMIAEEFEPLMNKRTARAAKSLGLVTLKPWDIGVVLDEGLRDRTLSQREMVVAASHVFGLIDADFGEHVAAMLQRDAIDLISRPNKKTINLATCLSLTGEGFVYGNLAGHPLDTLMVLHELGHTVHYTYAIPNKPYWLKFPNSEITEFVAYFFQLAGGCLLGASGLFSSNEMTLFSRHLHDEVLDSLLRVSNSERFQHWVFQSSIDTLTPSDLDAGYLRSVATASVDWVGHETVLKTLWQRRPHTFTYPLRDSCYAIAWMGVLQFLDLYAKDRIEAVHKLKTMMSLGNTATIAESYQALGLTFPFTHENVRLARETLQMQFSGT